MPVFFRKLKRQVGFLLKKKKRKKENPVMDSVTREDEQ